MKQVLEDAQEQLRRVYERETVRYTVKISTLGVTINQQNIKIKKLEKQIKELKKDADKTKTPEAFPYTYPIRDIPAYGKVKK